MPKRKSHPILGRNMIVQNNKETTEMTKLNSSIDLITPYSETKLNFS